MRTNTCGELNINHVGQEVTITGWVQTRRNLGKIVFLDVRDRAGLVQVVCVPNDLGADYDLVKDVHSEYVVEIKGLVNKRGAKNVNSDLATGEIEVLAKGFKVLAKAEPLPLDLEDEKIGLDVHLDNLPLTLRTEKWRAVFKVQSEIVEAFRAFLRAENFTEFQCPKIVGDSTEGGSNVFEIKYFDAKAYLAQSPQFYKQIMAGVFERVFTVGNVYRAEEHATTRHINEYTSLDLEFGMIKDHTDVMELETKFLRYLLDHLDKTVARELKLLNYVRPELPDKIPVFKLREAQELIKKETKTDHTAEPDLEPSEEKWICEYVKKKFKSDFVFVTHYPTVKRPMYTYPDEADPEFTKSFDLLFRGVEVTTGGQRINDYEQLVANIKKWGLKPEKFEFYLEAFKYGMPPEGGLAIGLERMTAKLLDIDNIKYATLFPRDLNRIDLQISLPEYKQKKD
ncbi:MAG: aspartate--tRNA(Asn) ligase [Candidatus Magasanikbacteria bacterium RIFCSPLOWO2_01_FULL_43_20b]|uniref:Aspartate--tRNA ligase n=1 Tax=Candidatus Magasanikbacteria bacterium RIFCSPLOWO2_12_FULL_43_12 TaxID=1798692 RepID=A0A1F6MRB0_9BACT|nr:MAG: aspartate--tRNA(Asn) ligase [Candidatus Magasanikbacteria bacterium RIFCSPLOWO2_02_FULL_43_22]OGH73374.1 MAG: aspartate--tRNA(Asn) ligase [Candidatus Magasanikbacteria bacterium RIFCSPLOWO2_01_FULL_43_20b]OGH74204.1 MAG: aspartate--tRNA(Asn) ligase [Candidatus Magasanikbacteria bacterium RIFCSPLOWO2_12_FULL_43_12]